MLLCITIDNTNILRNILIVDCNLLQALYAFILGALLVWTYERFAKLTAPIILHVSANLISILVQQSTWLSSYLQTYAVAACIIGLAGTAAGVVYITVHE